MNIERRLQHAARELRELPIDVPPLERRRSGGGATRVLQALAAPMLFVAGGLFAIGAARTTAIEPVQSDLVVTPTVVVEPDAVATEEAAVQQVSAPSVRAELEMIAQLVNSGQDRSADIEPATDGAPAAAPAPAGPADQPFSAGPI